MITDFLQKQHKQLAKEELEQYTLGLVGYQTKEFAKEIQKEVPVDYTTALSMAPKFLLKYLCEEKVAEIHVPETHNRVE